MKNLVLISIYTKKSAEPKVCFKITRCPHLWHTRFANKIPKARNGGPQ